jgi:hypothetical protein
MFLKYLNEKKVINSSDLVELLFERLEKTPSLLRVATENSFIDSDKALAIVVRGSEQGLSSVEILKEEMPKEDFESLLLLQQKETKNLGDLIIERSLLSREAFNKVVEDYETWKDEGDGETPEEEGRVEENITSKPPINAAALESLMGIEGLNPNDLASLEASVENKNEDSQKEEIIDEGTIKMEIPDGGSDENEDYSEYLDFYSQDLQNNLLVQSNMFKMKGKDKDLNQIHKSFSQILGLCKILDLKFQEKILVPLEEYISSMMRISEEERQSWQREFPFDALEVLWAFRETVNKGHGEGEALLNPSIKESYMKLYKNINQNLKRVA